MDADNRTDSNGVDEVVQQVGKPHRRHARRATWTDDQLEEVYDIRSMPKDTAMKTKNLLHVMRVIRHCNRATDLDASIALVIENCCELMGCDRATLFMVDEIHSQLVIRKAVGMMDDDVRIAWDQGIAGNVFHNGVTLNIPNVYKDTRFSGTTDTKFGYRTQSMLCAPVQDANNVTVAVIQAINKKAGADNPTSSSSRSSSSSGSSSSNNNTDSIIDGSSSGTLFVPFTMEDELLMDHLALQVGIILRNQMMRDNIVRSHEQVVSLLEIVRSLHSDLGLSSLMFTITEKSPGLVDADRCTLYLVDRQHGELVTLQGQCEIRCPLAHGLAGYAATHGEIVNITDAQEDNRFNKEFDRKSGFLTKSVLAMPIIDTSNSVGGDNATKTSTALLGTHGCDEKRQDNEVNQRSGGNVIGVLQLINKKHGPSFSAKDEQLLKSFLDILGPILRNSQIFHAAQRKPISEFEAASDIPMMIHHNKISESPRRTHSNNISRLGISSGLDHPIVEEEEEEDEVDT